MNLTKSEITALAYLDKRGVNSKFMPATINKLVAKGLARSTIGVVGWSPRFIITDAGRAALREEQSK